MREERELTDGLADVDPDARLRRRRRRRIGLLITAIVLVALLGTTGGYVVWALHAPLPAPTATSRQPGPPASGPAVQLALPTAASAISVSGGEAYLGPGASGIWATSGTNDPVPMASISKLITALVILDAKPLADANDPGPTITFSKADHDLYDKYYVMGATIVSMPTGSSMTQRDALAMMLLPSASNYAEAVSTWAFGSQGAFVAAARRWIAANGLAGTTLVEPTGISPRNTSTPTDLIALARLAAANPTVAALAATPSMVVPSVGTITNTNDLLGVDGITGLKTGNLGDGAYNLLYTASMDVGIGDRLAVTGVLLGGMSRPSVDNQVRAQLDSIREGFHDVPVASHGQQVGGYATPWGSTAKIVIAQEASILTWSDTPITVTMQTTTPKTYLDDEIVGSITWTAGPKTTTIPLVIEGDIEPPDDWWRLTHPDELG
ncbi:D-alanyl-D-alanine carboxypeptidase [Microbacterium jejuense]|uniref:D-alanyl-D-alanine carboxypeptidase n=2 Tax=Microbacterium jejuense TaxID=1263637 RepID=A0ABS7HI62_9MICO|nr:D-alanyl-D-alanine carboxypeptidase [Microbacterium jejuense]